MTLRRRTLHRSTRRFSRVLAMESLEVRHLLAGSGQNPIVAEDVNNSGFISIADFLPIVTGLRDHQGPYAISGLVGPPYPDVDGSGRVGIHDLLQVAGALRDGVAVPPPTISRPAIGTLDSTARLITGRIEAGLSAQTRLIGCIDNHTFFRVPLDAAGVFSFDVVDVSGRLEAGSHRVQLFAQNYGGPLSQAELSFTLDHAILPRVAKQIQSLGFDEDLSGWTRKEFGGSPEGRGSVTNGSAILHEGDSFLVGLEQTFVIPPDATSLQFSFTDLQFDTADSISINDAFEAALVDEQGRSLVHAIASGRDAFFNITEGQNASLGRGSQITGQGVQNVSVDLSALAPGSVAKLIFRLVNNDSDTTTSVRILDVHIGGGDNPPEATLHLLNDTAPPGLGTDVYRSDRLTTDSRLAGTISDDSAVEWVELQIDGGAYQNITAAFVNSAFVFDPGILSPGAHTATIRAIDTGGQTTQARLDFVVNRPPLAIAGGPRIVEEGGSLTFDASSSSDSEAPIFNYVWMFSDSSTATGATVTRSFPQAGVFPVTLTVTDTAGAISTDTINVSVTSLPAVLTAVQTFEAKPTANGPQLAAVVSGSYGPGVTTDDGITGRIIWGDNNTEDLPLTFTGGAVNFSHLHIYANPGMYEATVILYENAQPVATVNLKYGVARVDISRTIDLTRGGSVPVLVFRDPTFDATKLDVSTLRFGPGGAKPANNVLQVRPADVRANFSIPESGIRRTDTAALLTGKLLNGTPFAGMDTITVIGPEGEAETSVNSGNHTTGGNTSAIVSPAAAPPTAAWLNRVPHHPNPIVGPNAEGEEAPGPTISLFSPTPNSSANPDATLLISGQALPGPSRAAIVQVLVNGATADAVDAAGNFFAQVALASGGNTFAITAIDALGDESSATVTVNGIQRSERAIPFDLLSNIGGSLLADYGRTSFHEKTNVLAVDVAIRNAGDYVVDAPLLVGVTNLSDPSVRVRDADGVTSEGVPYFDFTPLTIGPTLEPGESSGVRTLEFFTPSRQQFTYDLVFLGRLNDDPVVTTVPDIEAVAGRPYEYDVDALDVNDDDLRYSLAVYPQGMSINANTGTISWTPTLTDVASQMVIVIVEDGRGGVAQQRYALSTIQPPPNRPPVFTSTPVVGANLDAEYRYAPEA